MTDEDILGEIDQKFGETDAKCIGHIFVCTIFTSESSLNIKLVRGDLLCKKMSEMWRKQWCTM